LTAVLPAELKGEGRGQGMTSIVMEAEKHMLHRLLWQALLSLEPMSSPAIRHPSNHKWRARSVFYSGTTLSHCSFQLVICCQTVHPVQRAHYIHKGDPSACCIPHKKTKICSCKHCILYLSLVISSTSWDCSHFYFIKTNSNC
jgi:hypothetical protein